MINSTAFGVALTYTYGDYDIENYCGYNTRINKEFTLEFICNRRVTDFTESLNNAIIIEEYGETGEGEACIVTIRLETVLGCPDECPRDNDGNLCSDQGSCGYDTRDNLAKCFCFAGKQ